MGFYPQKTTLFRPPQKPPVLYHHLKSEAGTPPICKTLPPPTRGKREKKLLENPPLAIFKGLRGTFGGFFVFFAPPPPLGEKRGFLVFSRKSRFSGFLTFFDLFCPFLSIYPGDINPAKLLPHSSF